MLRNWAQQKEEKMLKSFIILPLAALVAGCASLPQANRPPEVVRLEACLNKGLRRVKDDPKSITQYVAHESIVARIIEKEEISDEYRELLENAAREVLAKAFEKHGNLLREVVLEKVLRLSDGTVETIGKMGSFEAKFFIDAQGDGCTILDAKIDGGIGVIVLYALVRDGLAYSTDPLVSGLFPDQLVWDAE